MVEKSGRLITALGPQKAALLSERQTASLVLSAESTAHIFIIVVTPANSENIKNNLTCGIGELAVAQTTPIPAPWAAGVGG